MRYLHCIVKFQLRKLGWVLTWYKNAVPQLQNCVALQLNQKFLYRSCAKHRKLKKIKLHIFDALLQVKKLVAPCCAAL